MLHVFLWLSLLLYLLLALLLGIGTGIGYLPAVSGAVATLAALCLACGAAWLADRTE